MRTHIQTKHKAELIKKAHKLHKYGYSYSTIAKQLQLERDEVKRWVNEYHDFLLDGDPNNLVCIKRCLPYLGHPEQTNLRTPKMTILWGLIKIY